MKPYKWRNRSTSAVYVDSATGSDIYGDGTMNNPYRSLGKAWRGHTTYHPSVIYCRGTFSEDMSDGSHSTAIYGDYLGAATFDGAGIYTCYGFTTGYMFFNNCPAAAYGISASPSGTSPAGVGRASSAGNVGTAYSVYGVAAPSVILRASGLYMGAIGGTPAVKNVAFISPVCASAYAIWLGGNGGQTLYANTVYDVPKANRTKARNTNRQYFTSWIFGKCALYIDDCITFTQCVFASDCEFYDGDTLLTPEGVTSEERQAWLTNYIADKGVTSNVKSIFTDCVFSDKSSYDIFNDPDNGDVTPRYDTLDKEVMPTPTQYRGALQPAVRVPILTDSEGVAGAWDELTASGLIGVQDNKVVLTDITGSDEGEILSKVIVTDPGKISITALFAAFASRYQSDGVRAGGSYPEGKQYPIGSTLPEGRYVARGGALLAGEDYIAEGEIIVAGADGVQISDAGETESGDAYAVEILDANIDDTLELRTSPAAYSFVKASDALQAGGVYCNIYDKEIMYRGRRVVHNESFVAANSTDHFSCDDPDYKVAVIFDDTRVPAQPWIPAQQFGEYFAGRSGGVYQTDEDGTVLGSGNYLSYQTTANGGYSDTIRKTVAQARYVQLRLQVKRFSSVAE